LGRRAAVLHRNRLSLSYLPSTVSSQDLSGRPLTTSFYDNVANAQFALSNLNWGNAFNVRTTNAIGMHHFDVDGDGAAFGWLQRADRRDRRGKTART
jgi:hypothetical protein